MKQNQSKVFFFPPRTRDCPIPVEACLNRVIHCLMWDRAFNYGLIISADVEFSGDVVGWLVGGQLQHLGFLLYFFETKLVL